MRCHRNQSKTTGSQCGGGENGKPSAKVGSHDYNYDDSGNFDEDDFNISDGDDNGDVGDNDDDDDDDDDNGDVGDDDDDDDYRLGATKLLLKTIIDQW